RLYTLGATAGQASSGTQTPEIRLFQQSANRFCHDARISVNNRFIDSSGGCRIDGMDQYQLGSRFAPQ
ncbi:MAG: hypothetical protein KKE86_05945, partial [Planctomycetes bacterium]|nr:hypothetical protein [Planctomycetota bacterium]